MKMPATDYQGSSVPFASLGRSILSIRREQVHAMSGHDGGEQELDAFQRQVADLFADLAGEEAASGAEEILSISWLRKLLDTFIVCLEEFRVILFNHRAIIGRPPLDRLLADFFERGVKALDVCNAVRDGIDQIRQWRRHIEIVLVALGGERAPGQGQLRRAKKALADLTILMLDEKDASAGSVFSSHLRNRSFGRNSGSSASGGGRDHQHRTHFRSLSWSVSRSWSAAKQLQAIGNNINAPRTHDVAATSGLAVPIYTMSTVLLFVMWVLVAAIPCQDRGLQVHFSVARQFVWSVPLMSLHDRILEESKKRDRKHSSGLLKEIHQTERCMHQLTQLMDGIQCLISEESVAEMTQGLEELTQVCEAMKEGLDPLERQVREVFLRLVRSRTEGFDSLSHIAE